MSGDLTPTIPAICQVPAHLTDDMRAALHKRERAEHAIEEHGPDDDWAQSFAISADADVREVLMRAGHPGYRVERLPWVKDEGGAA